MTEQRFDEETGQTTTGHSYDGIEELNTPLPRWWLGILYATIIWGVIYTIAYPAWPLISGATQGVLGYSSRADLATDIAEFEDKNAAFADALLTTDLATLAPGSDLYNYATARGGATFRAHCSQCHGAGAGGALGYPNLLDNDWLWGGSVDEILFSVQHGIRNQSDDAARFSQMPAFGDILSDDDIATLANYVAALPEANPQSPGAQLFADNCAICHGDNGLGNRDMGAPNLADAIWLYGGGQDNIAHSISQPPFGVMPAWGQRLPEADIRAVSVYVHALGGGE